MQFSQYIFYKQFLELKAKLESAGMFDASKKKPLPEVIKRVGVVSSETGAVIQDIYSTIRRYNNLINICIINICSYPIININGMIIRAGR